jgi:hypothetical protein
LPFGRRGKSLHERLAQQGGLDFGQQREQPPHDPTPRLGITALHGMHRAREWDVVATAEAPAIPGVEVHFVALPDGSLVVEEDVPDGALEPLADAVESQISPPYRAEAVKRAERVWGVAGRRIEVAEVPEEIDGDVVELAVVGDQRTLDVDGEESSGGIRSLERLAQDRGLDTYVVRATRLDGTLWEVAVSPL